MDEYFEQFQSNNYWKQDDEKINQRLYVTLCLYQSACSDFATSLDLNKDKRYSWAVISSYYSIMHSLRTIIFMVIGDFPMEHSALNKIFYDEQDTPTINHYLGRSWLKNFDSNFQEIGRNLNYFNRNHLAEHYSRKHQFTDSDKHFSNISKLLNLTKKIRNDSNYEALIIAHEKKHIIVSDSFIRLTTAILKAAEYCISIATKCIKHYIELNEEFRFNKDRIKWFTYEFLLTRFTGTIEARSKRKYLTSKIHKFSRNIISSFLETDFADIELTISEEYLEIENSISLKIFGEKRNLMNKFHRNVNKLEESVSNLKIIRN